MSEADWALEYSRARQRIDTLLSGIDAEQAAHYVPSCPEWTIHDLLSHLVGISTALAAGDMPGEDLQAWIDQHVAARASTSTGDVLAEWRDAGASIDACVRGLGPGAGMLLYDAVAHEHDLRLALEQPGDRTSSGVSAAVIAKSIELEEDLKQLGLPPIRINSPAGSWNIGAGSPGLSITLEPFEFLRVFGSRRSLAQLSRLDWDGDFDAYLPAIAHLPLPEADIIE
ncbi:hypothetical protein A5761_10030 [Mycolicibacterium setense]|uniref:maleylpyruvate isomerase family mycothiol-dependent enzyme n=1 Tax=Mycolicibacterium setense TaxID=431269 RepID=UPI0007EA29AD|nr:maleylpyruvate isomerase family mycothiol-dependent enzyme [Mycolicibacterium setense]OBB17681.1 hypothetical protein A5761_10030 [Mycolicibacterium setense]